MIKIAINGYGRIGRNILRALYEAPHHDNIKIVAINALGDPEVNIHLTRYDTTHGHFNAEIVHEGDELIINGDRIRLLSDKDPLNLPWKELNVDFVMECTGRFTTRETASLHLQAGAKKVLISAPAKSEVDATIVYGANHKILKPTDQIISNASCTTNCLVPLVKPLHEKLGIVKGFINTVHAYTNDQVLIDGRHSDLRRARAAGHSMIPTKTGAASAVGSVLPELAGKLDGLAIRVPTINVSLLDLTFEAERETTANEVNQIVQAAAESDLKDVLAVNEAPLVSVDFNHNPASAILDATQTKVNGNLVKVLAWYDNEWGFSNRMLDVAQYVSQM